MFFSSPVHKELVAQIKKDSSVLPRIAALSEVTWLPFLFYLSMLDCCDGYSLYLVPLFIFQMNLEYFAIDSQVSIFLKKDHWFLIRLFILFYGNTYISAILTHLVSYRLD